MGLSHAALGIVQGLENGDFGLLHIAAMFALPTFLAAGLVAVGGYWPRVAAVALMTIAVGCAVLLAPLYLLGLFHLPQAITALVITARAKP